MIKKLLQKSIQEQMNLAFRLGAKEGENNNPYRALKDAIKAYGKGIKK